MVAGHPVGAKGLVTGVRVQGVVRASAISGFRRRGQGCQPPVMRRAGEHGMLVLFDGYNPFDANQPCKFTKLGPRVPRQLLIFEILARYPWCPGNVYRGLSATAEMFAASPYGNIFCWVMCKIGIERILYGSDSLVCDPVAALNAVRALNLAAEEEGQILYRNAAALLDRS